MELIEKNNIICIIPARGGSKGIPHKNLKEIDGISLVGRAIKTASKSKLINQVYVSSDDNKILSEAEKYSAIPLKRSVKASSDESSTEDALFDALDKLEQKNNVPEIFVYIQCTSPFINSEDIDKAIKLLKRNHKIDTVFSAVESHVFLWGIENNVGFGKNHEAYKQRERRQDLKKTYREDGCFYVVRLDRFKQTMNRFGTSALPYLNSLEMPFEIDDIRELEMARALVPFFKN